MTGTPAPYHMTGTPAPHHMTGTPAPHHMTGTPAPHHMIGTPEPFHMTSTSAPHHMTGTSVPNHMTSAAAPPHLTNTLAPHHMTGTAALPPSYGFVTNNWIEERQSWFPEEPPPTADTSDPAAELEPQNPTHLQGFQVGFENFGDLSYVDPAAHYHQIACPSGAFLTPNAGGRGLVRSQTLREDAWRGDEERRQMRRFSMYDVQPRAPDHHRHTQITDWKIPILETSSNKNTAFSAFCESVKLIRSEFSATDAASNPGRLWSVAIPFPEEVEDSEVEISVYVENLETPLLLLQRDTVRIEDLISDILHKLHGSASALYPSLHTPDYIPPTHRYPDQDRYYPPQNLPSQSLYPSLNFSPAPDSPPYPPDPNRKVSLLRICGGDEYLQRGFSLRSHSSLQRLSRIRLRLHDGGDVALPLARSVEDDGKQLELSDRQEHLQYWAELRARCSEKSSSGCDETPPWTGQVVGLRIRQHRHLSAVSNVTFPHNAAWRLMDLLPFQKEAAKRRPPIFVFQNGGIGGLLEAVKEICYLLRSVETKEISEAVQSVRTSCYWPHQVWAASPQGKTPAQDAVTALSLAISRLINVHSRSFCADFQTGNPDEPHGTAEPRDHLTFHLYAAHDLPYHWATSQNAAFYISCSVTYSGRKICPEIRSGNVKATQSLFSRLVWDEVMTFPLPLAALPYETILVLRLCAVTDTRSSFLAWSCLPLYPTQQMVGGTLLLNMISHAEPPAAITPGAFDVALPTLVTLQWGKPAEFRRRLSEADKLCLWHYRHCANKPPGTLPLLLGSAPSWDPPSVSAMYSLLQDWSFTDPLEGLSLLSPCFSDENIRDAACRQIGKMSDDELLEFLPQLVQAVKFDWCLDSALVKLLLRRSLRSVQIAHRLFWLLTDATNESHYRRLYQTLLAALQFCTGSAMNAEFSRETEMMKILQSIGERVKNAPEEKRQETLKSGLNDLGRFFEEVKSCRLPLYPAIVVKGISRELCSYFKSNAKPLKITFLNADSKGPDIHLIFKAGDDIRQDMLILQIINLMDRIWLHEGLDLRMVTYRCLSTGRKQGLIEMVPDSTTLAKIQNAGGLFGPLKDSSMKKWFGGSTSLIHNFLCSVPQAADNFLYSCAGWCVATFILGVCDRHNDNIMLTSTGHMFHIDFGKILGNAQMFGKVKRDRSPFIFTSEMENFITEGGRSPQRAQEFVDLCCCAYNIIRRHSALLITALELMLQAGLPELSGVHDLKYVHDNLRPYDSDLQATSYFTSKITESLQCVSVKLNFLVHAFANMSPGDAAKLAGQGNPSLPKFIRKTAVKGLKKISKMVRAACDTLPEVRQLYEFPSSLVSDIWPHGGIEDFSTIFPPCDLRAAVLPPPTAPVGINGRRRFLKNGSILFLGKERILTELKATMDNEPASAGGKCPSCDEDRDSGDIFLCTMMDVDLLNEYDIAGQNLLIFLFSDWSDGERGIQLHFSFSPPVFSVLLKHLRNIHLLDGSAPSASVTISLHCQNMEISREEVKSPARSPAPTFNKLVQFSVGHLAGHVMKFQVKSKGSFLGELSVSLSTVPLNKDVWYRLGG
ncbi:PREDICTED: phosphatidylinositol 4-phosphate 3-kinase C2 domain-containing subunit gamma [Nanorana parkeri]|uniref:phosphatidylinositol 4-phosphate 3-kinase C2 domain-containing subunit gamma n=1 Tax=Nanorana parkeri TaxID=125878 RepID=UPI00085416D8|nr:PREDICTED: phosphatidylinositol 4-phosphate 3-kinase C2 domain-containing subunit gamma [Nanorana parkeri]